MNWTSSNSDRMVQTKFKILVDVKDAASGLKFKVEYMIKIRDILVKLIHNSNKIIFVRR